MSTIQSLRALPKVQLHCHLEGTLCAATFLEFAAKYGLPAAQASVEQVYRFADFGQFLLTFQDVCRSLRTPEEYVRLLREYAADARMHSVMYAELFISPSVWRFFHPEIDVTEVCAELWKAAQQIAKTGGPEIRFICDLTRNFGAESGLQSARAAEKLQSYGVIGIGLGGDEAKFPPELFADAFAHARAVGLHSVVHAGEAAGPQSVRNAIEVLHAERIGHGIRAVEDPAVVQLLIERRIALEVCPTSNFRTGVALEHEPHPLRALDEAGVTITLDSDDPALFGTDLTAEYAFAEKEVGFDGVLRFARNAIEASFADETSKASMRGHFERACAELIQGRRT